MPIWTSRYLNAVRITCQDNILSALTLPSSLLQGLFPGDAVTSLREAFRLGFCPRAEAGDHGAHAQPRGDRRTIGDLAHAFDQNTITMHVTMSPRSATSPLSDRR